ncbi:MAG: GNAT family N-acetyltransferase [Vicinamibacterales bacterium]
MSIEIRRGTAEGLSQYARVSIAFEVTQVYDVTTRPGDRLDLIVRQLAEPYAKDYDAVGEPPTEWPRQFDISPWSFFAAFEHGRRVGGATVACRTPSLDMLEGRHDLVVLWDIRVAPSARRRGVGAALFSAATEWAAATGYQELKVETQNVNVPACRFYERHGCVLRSANRGMYAELPEEIQLLWYKRLAPVPESS